MEFFEISSINISVEALVHIRRGLLSQTPKWIISIWDRQHAIQPALLRVPLVIFSFFLLWAVNVYFMERANIPYHKVLSVKHISAFAVLVRSLLSLSFYAVLVTTANVMHMELEQSMIGFYVLMVVLVMLPALPGLDYRAHLLRLLRQVFFPVPNSTYLALNPSGPLTRARGGSTPTRLDAEQAVSLLKNNENAAVSVVPFVEVLVADALCSLSKVFKDLGTSAVALFAFVSGTEVAGYHYPGMIIVAIMASIPYLIRVRQCSIQFYYATDPHSRTCIAINIFKYATSFPSIWITAAVTLGYFSSNETIHWAIGFAMLNSLISCVWDLVMDWGLFSISLATGKVTFRVRTYYHTVFYLFAVVSNICFRFSWAINRLPYFGSLSPSQLILILEAVEVFRRFIWNFLRIEWEVINTKGKAERLEALASTIDSTVGDNEAP